jgi:aldose 1-epimerase
MRMPAGYRGPDEAGRQEPSEGETVMRTIRKGLRSRAQTRPRIPRKITRTGVGVALVAALTALGALAATTASAAPSAKAGGGGHGHLSISKQYFGSTVEPYTGQNTPTYRYTLTNAKGMSVDLLSYGAITQAIWVPGGNGQRADVVLGFKTLQDYVTFVSPPVTANGGPYFGETVGRYANRIALGTFKLQLVSPNGDASGAAGSPGCPSGCTGYPAQITVDVTFTLNNAGQYGIHYKVHNDSSTLSTVQNLTNHSYFNLAGENSAAGSAYGQYVQINADNYSPTDTTQIPLPGLPNGVPVAGTPFDFRTPQTIGSRISEVSAPDNVPASDASLTKGESQLLIAQGYDHNWILNAQTPHTTGPDGLNLAAKAWDPGSGRALAVWTDQPGVQFYSGNFLTGTLVGISGNTYRQGAGYTFETQHYPNSPNNALFPSTTLGPNDTFASTTVFAFSS